VKKGEVLVTLENQEYIQLQQDYLDNLSKLEFLEAEYKRQLDLANENVNAQKSLQQSKSQFESTRATVKGLEAKLAMINIKPASLAEGKIQSTISLYAPISGFVTTVNVSPGQYVSATEAMFKIVNLEHVHAELEVYEKDIRKIVVGQKVDFQVTGEEQHRTASVYLLGKEISPERTVRVHCHLEKEDPSLLPGMFLTANIETASLETDVVPTRAIHSFEGTSIVFFASGENQFKAVPVKTGTSTAEYTAIELPDKTDRDASIVVDGGFQLMGLLKNMQED
jgi:cobalt-zinc-cadmium efflux system membrane fusion protein